MLPSCSYTQAKAEFKEGIVRLCVCVQILAPALTLGGLDPSVASLKQASRKSMFTNDSYPLIVKSLENYT